MNISLILVSIFLSLVSFSYFISGLILLLIFIYIRPSISNVSLLLTCNSYLTIIVFCLTLLDIGAHRLHGHINPSISFAGRWCEARAYFAHVCFCAFYYSFALQAIFRLFRIVFYKKKILQSFGVFMIAIFLQWFLSFVFILPHIFLNDFQYQSFEYNCWISFKNIRGMLSAILIIYGGPLLIIFVTYIYILRYVRRTITTKRKRKKSNKRDVIVLRRIVILVLILIIIGVPTLSVLVIYIITGYLTPLAYDIQAVNISIGLVTTIITLVFVTPQIRKISHPNGLQILRRNTQQGISDSSR
jgi:hypothetical protein